MKTATYERGTKYGFRQMKIDETKTVYGTSKRRVQQALLMYNNALSRGERLGAEVKQIGNQVKITRTF